MGRVGRLIQAECDEFIEQTVEAYKDANMTVRTFAPGGDDSPPLPDDRIVLVSVDGTGGFAAVGVLSRSQGAKPGERILYSRDEDGNARASVRLLGDGTVEIEAADENGDAQAVLSVGGDGSLSLETMGDGGITIKDKDGNKVESSSSGLKLTDKSGNSVEMSSSGMTLTDAKGGKVEMAGKITVQGLSGKLEVS